MFGCLRDVGVLHCIVAKRIQLVLRLLAEQGLCNGRGSVCLSGRRPSIDSISGGRRVIAGLLLSALRAGNIVRQLRSLAPRSSRGRAQQQLRAVSRLTADRGG